MSNNIKVCIRCRPFAAREKGETCCVQMPTKQHVLVSDDKGVSKDFDFDRAYWSHNPSDSGFATQQTLMDELGNEILKNSLDGFNGCMFAYGQTGAGKTFSVLGADDPPELRGLLPRIIEEFFSRIDQIQADPSKGTEFQCKVSYLEIYNEQLRDLLIPVEQRDKSKLEIHMHPKLGLIIPGLTENVVENYVVVKRMQDFGAKTRSVAATNMNAGSSRSHCVFTFDLDKTSTQNGVKSQLRSRVNLVDLAGSERQSKTGATGDRLKEGSMINQSLSNLAIVIHKLAEVSDHAAAHKRKTSADFVPFRNSKLTHLLQESLSGNSRTVMVAAISPALSNFEETVSTLRFAMTCKSIKTNATKNEESSENIIASLKAEIEKLKAGGATGEVGGDPEMEDKLKQSEALKAKFEQDYNEQLAEATKKEEERAKALEDMGLTVQELSQEAGIDPNVPQLVNISDDPSLSGCLVYFLLEGSETAVGDDPSCRIRVSGLGMKPFLCSFKNERNDIITLTLLSPRGQPLPVGSRSNQAVPASKGGDDKPGRMLVNGRAPQSGVKLQHKDRLILGHCYCFRLVVPVQAGQTPGRGMPGQADTDIEEALYEVVHEHTEEFEQARTLVDEMEDRIGTERASNFLKVFGQVLPLVEEANLISREVRPRDGLRFQLEVCSDVLSYKTDEPELVVRLYRTESSRQGGEEQAIGVFELYQFKERLGHLRETYDAFKTDPGRTLARMQGSGGDPWATYSFSQVRDLLQELQHKIDDSNHKAEQAESKVDELLRSTREKQGELSQVDALRRELAERDRKIAELTRAAGRNEGTENLIQQKTKRIMELETENSRLKAESHGLARETAGGPGSPATLPSGTGAGLEAKLKHAGEESIAAAQLATKLLMSLQEIKEDLQQENQQIENLRRQMSEPPTKLPGGR